MRYGLICLFFLAQFTQPTFAGLAELYTDTSKSLYEFVNNKTCGDLNKSNQQEKDRITSCIECATHKKNLLKDFNQIVEYTYFQQAAEEESKNLSCTIKRAELTRSSKDMRDKIKLDIIGKLPLLSTLNKQLIKKKAEYLQLEGNANSMRSWAMSGQEKRSPTNIFIN